MCFQIRYYRKKTEKGLKYAFHIRTLQTGTAGMTLCGQRLVRYVAGIRRYMRLLKNQFMTKGFDGAQKELLKEEKYDRKRQQIL